MAKARNSSRKFHLKPFSLFHHRATMKVGMDSILLGIWAETKNSRNILDIGTGSGILSLMAAYKSESKIEAIELDHDSIQEAHKNFKSSPFHNRMSVIEKDFILFAENGIPKYDLIISNPPFFVNDYKSENKKKNQARHSDSLNYKQLIEGVKKLLLPGGKFYLVLPYEESRLFLDLAKSSGMFLQKQQLISPIRGSQANRINMLLGSDEPKKIITDYLVIREEDRNFTEDYKNFVRDVMIVV